MMKKNIEHSHQAEDIEERLSIKPKRNYLRDWIYGGIDGAVTTFAIISGVKGAHLATSVILILGFANVIADGFSMAAANYLGTRSEKDEYDFYERYERKQVRRIPEGEAEEVRQIYKQKGFSGIALEKTVELITADEDRWVETMMQEEYGLSPVLRSPWKSAWATFLSFMLCGLCPLVPFLFAMSNPFLWSTISVGIVFLVVGALKSLVSIEPMYKSALATLAIGSVAAVLAYGVGVLLRGLGAS
jgi:VIT1/CCC1 family predicted Fe2+/Mn2+ transporter